MNSVPPPMRFELEATDGSARAGRLTFARGVVDTPVPGQPGRYWLHAVMDNLTRGGALNALEIAAAALA